MITFALRGSTGASDQTYFLTQQYLSWVVFSTLGSKCFFSCWGVSFRYLVPTITSENCVLLLAKSYPKYYPKKIKVIKVPPCKDNPNHSTCPTYLTLIKPFQMPTNSKQCRLLNKQIEIYFLSTDDHPTLQYSLFTSSSYNGTYSTNYISILKTLPSFPGCSPPLSRKTLSFGFPSSWRVHNHRRLYRPPLVSLSPSAALSFYSSYH